MKTNFTNKEIMAQAFGELNKNNLTGWYLDEVIDFCFWHNVYVKGRKSLENIIKELTKKCHMTNSQGQEYDEWANDIAQVIEYCVVDYLDLLDEYEGDCDECNLQLSAQIVGDSLVCRVDASWYAHAHCA